jgi:hypothetical protein
MTVGPSHVLSRKDLQRTDPQGAVVERRGTHIVILRSRCQPVVIEA